MAQCIHCLAEKPATEFYAHPDAVAGHSSICKECHKHRMRVRARINPSVQEYDRNRAKTPMRRVHTKNAVAKWRAQNPLGLKAHSAVARAVSKGVLKKLSCQSCGEGRVHAHHSDYTKPLDVIWLCAKCHHRMHAGEKHGQLEPTTI